MIALGDVITQTMFTPVHEECFRVLRSIPEDGTFKQDEVRSRVKDATLRKGKLYSIDMTACTDRFPASLQMLVLYWTGIMNLRQAIS